MNLLAIIPAGQTVVTVNGLHQWDYGRKLEIQSDDLPALVEVHYACDGMDSAIVYACEAVNGKFEVAIPNRCLEQSAPITAWIYAVGENAGSTLKTLILTVIKRTRPQESQSIPEEISDKYTEAVGAMNDAVDKLKAGDVLVSNAVNARNATYDSNGRNIVATYHTTETFNGFTEALQDGSFEVYKSTRAGLADKATTSDHATNANKADMASIAEVVTLTGPGSIVNTNTDSYDIIIPGIYYVLVGNGVLRYCDFIAIPNLTTEVRGNYVQFTPVDGEYGHLRPYNEIGNIRTIIKIAEGAAG